MLQDQKALSTLKIRCKSNALGEVAFCPRKNVIKIISSGNYDRDVLLNLVLFALERG
jgi:hypothetical protein